MKRFVGPTMGMITLLVALIILGNFVPLTVEHPEYGQGCSCMNGGISVWVDEEDVFLGSGPIAKRVATGESYAVLISTSQPGSGLTAMMTWKPDVADNAKFTFDPQEVKDNSPNDRNPAAGSMTALFTVTAPKEPGSYSIRLSTQGPPTLSFWVDVGSVTVTTQSVSATTTSVPFDTSPLTETEKYWLTYLREVEKLAREVYRYHGDKWNFQFLKDLVESEQKHMDALEPLLDNHGIPDPVAGKGPGVFVNPDLQKLYSELIPQGSVSLVEALKVGVLIEEKDIDHLKEAIATANHEDLKTVYDNPLLQGSTIHLNAFQFELLQYSTTISAPQTTSQGPSGIHTTETIVIIIVAIAAVVLVGAFYLRRTRK